MSGSGSGSGSVAPLQQNRADDVRSKNQSYFRQLREQQDATDAAEADKLRKLDSTTRGRLAREREEAEKHQSDKTNHFAKLGRTFARSGANLLSSPRGRGRGR